MYSLFGRWYQLQPSYRALVKYGLTEGSEVDVQQVRKWFEEDGVKYVQCRPSLPGFSFTKPEGNRRLLEEERL